MHIFAETMSLTRSGGKILQEISYNLLLTRSLSVTFAQINGACSLSASAAERAALAGRPAWIQSLGVSAFELHTMQRWTFLKRTPPP